MSKYILAVILGLVGLVLLGQYGVSYSDVIISSFEGEFTFFGLQLLSSILVLVGIRSHNTSNN